MTDDESPAGRAWETIAGAVSAVLAVVFGMFDQVFAAAGTVLSMGGIDAVVNTLYANAPTLFTMLSVAQSEFQSVLTSILPAAVWQTLTLFAGLLFLLALGDRFTDDFRQRLKR